MTIHVIKEHTVSYPIKQVFELVADVTQYEEFIPWCSKSVVLEKKEDHAFEADLTVGFGPFEETYRSQVACTPYREIYVRCHEKPLKHLETRWQFEEVSPTQTKVTFEINFSLRSRLFQTMIKAAFQQSMDQVLQAFEKRLAELERGTE